jgi:hypothetical protein
MHRLDSTTSGATTRRGTDFGSFSVNWQFVRY